MPEVKNWFGDLVSHPQMIVDVHSVDDIVAVLKDPGQYPSPVRAAGSNHSTAPCAAADGGTLLRMKMNRILNVGTDTVTVEAGAIYLDIAEELEKHNLQFHVNTEIGNLSAGSAACAGTKDASFPGEFGQVGSYVTALKMVLPSGEIVEVTEAQPELMQKVRASYGLFGIIFEVTFRVRPIVPMHVHHKTFSLKDFLATLPELKRLGYSIMYYIFVFDDRITVEFRKYNSEANGDPNRHLWHLRNYMWAQAGPKFAHDTEQNVRIASLRYALIDNFGALWRLNAENILHSNYTIAKDQIIRYPEVSNDSRYTFSLFAFPEDKFPQALTEYFQFCRDYERKQHYRTNMLDVGYRIAQDQNSLLSYSWDGPVMTIDPVSTANPGWTKFLEAYNEFCSERGGTPVPNQTYGITPSQARKSFGDRLDIIEQTRRQYDPTDRLLNEYFMTLLRPVQPPSE
jgi:FAD/FMN-containing dehydrogenase